MEHTADPDFMWQRRYEALRADADLNKITDFEEALAHEIKRSRFMLRRLHGIGADVYFTYEPISIGVLTVETVKRMIALGDLYVAKTKIVT